MVGSRTMNSVPKFGTTLLLALAGLGLVLGLAHAKDGAGITRPNIVLIFCDDLGYADLGCTGSEWNQTPELDRMRDEGVRFTDFYAGAPVCTPSRAGLMTGCQARRVDLDLDHNNAWVLFPKGAKGLNPDEVTLPELLRDLGYATAIIGKWHLGDQEPFFPVRHGFDYWFGIPYSNDMEVARRGDPPLPLVRGTPAGVEIVQQEAEHRAFDQSPLTLRYTREAIEWMRGHRERPFFLYLPHTMPHNPVAARAEFLDRTTNPRRAFGACVAELSWSTGEILRFLNEEGLAERTLVLFTSDNGGQPRFGARNDPLRGTKGTTWEGGVRVPMLAWWPGTIPPGTTCTAPASVLDLLPTFVALAGGSPPGDRNLDGIDISDYLIHPDAPREPRPHFYWHVGRLEAVRHGDWKLVLPKPEPNREADDPDGADTPPPKAMLFHLRDDIGETQDVAGQHPDVVERLGAMARAQIAELGQGSEPGPGVRRTMRVENPSPVLRVAP